MTFDKGKTVWVYDGITKEDAVLDPNKVHKVTIEDPAPKEEYIFVQTSFGASFWVEKEEAFEERRDLVKHLMTVLHDRVQAIQSNRDDLAALLSE